MNESGAPSLRPRTRSGEAEAASLPQPTAEEPGPSVVPAPGMSGEYTSQPWPVVCTDRDIVNLSTGSDIAQQVPVSAPLLCVTPREALGSTISRALQEKIWKSEFVELGSLLKNAPVSESNTPMVLTLSGATLQLQPHRNVPRITSIEQWTSAFLVYASVFVQKHLARASEMFKYMDIVRTAARLEATAGALTMCSFG